jgi:hypothetical protein
MAAWKMDAPQEIIAPLGSPYATPAGPLVAQLIVFTCSFTCWNFIRFLFLR